MVLTGYVLSETVVEQNVGSLSVVAQFTGSTETLSIFGEMPRIGTSLAIANIGHAADSSVTKLESFTEATTHAYHLCGVKRFF